MSYDRFPETKIIGYDHEVFNDEQAIYQELLKYKDQWWDSYPCQIGKGP